MRTLKVGVESETFITGRVLPNGTMKL